MIFYTGIFDIPQMVSFDHAFLSANRLRRRKSDFPANNWIMDSGAFTEISMFGHYRHPVSEHADLINRWAVCGNMELAVAQDYMCEPFILAKTGMTVLDHQRLTIERYDELLALTDQPIMPVLQGFWPMEYLRHIDLYGGRLKPGMRVGIGSVCKRNGTPKAIVDVIWALKAEAPELLYHGFSVKYTALLNAYIHDALYSADSMAWSFAARKQGRDGNSVIEALEYTEKIRLRGGKTVAQLPLI